MLGGKLKMVNLEISLVYITPRESIGLANETKCNSDSISVAVPFEVYLILLITCMEVEMLSRSLKIS